jgi:hypothetical protein
MKAFKETRKLAQKAGAQASETKRLLAASASTNQGLLEATNKSSKGKTPAEDADQGLLEATENLLEGSKGKRPAEDEAGESPTAVDCMCVVA